MNTLGFDSKEWHMLTIIFKQFNHDLTKFKMEETLDQHLWKIIIGLKHKWLEDIEQTIRYNTRLCYELDKENEIKNINQSLFKFHNLFDRNFYRQNSDPYPGLKKFLKLINTIFKDLKEFKKDIRQSKAMMNFIKKRNDEELIKHYKYLKEISLPLKGYDKLRMALLTVIKKLDHLPILVTIPAAYSEFIKDIEQFKKLYREKYLKEHQNFQQKLDFFMERLHTLEEYKALELLSNIKVLEVTYNLKPVKNYIDNFFPQQCTLDEADIKEELIDSPRCQCGFNFNENLVIPSLAKITPLLKKGIKQHVNELKNKNCFQEKLLTYTEKHPNSKVKQFINSQGKNINKIIKLIDRDLIEEINKALTGAYNVNISLKKVIPVLKGSYSVSEIDELGKELSDQIYKILEEKKIKIGKINSDQIIINLVQ